ncbi:unnamed protein product [Periconia digitata]|uniref:alpha-galactosidase n=1 Tax=Periconia digitata TaxID=1303443 RepID=A0A9W4UMY0_9PLEO|nr:unnamed protein product [Periconia digitata]
MAILSATPQHQLFTHPTQASLSFLPASIVQLFIMHFATTLALAGVATAFAIEPRAEVKKFPKGTIFDMVLDSSKLQLSDFQKSKAPVLSIDLDDNYGIIKTLAKTKTVLCYFSAGSYEDWRDDKDLFKKGDYGKALDPRWEGEYWINVKSDNVKSIMEKRIIKAKEAGCHGVDPDNVDGYNPEKEGEPPQDGFNYGQTPYVDYIKFLALKAHENDLAIGLKNAVELVGRLVGTVDYAMNEQCHFYNECAAYEVFTDADKAVFNVEYELTECPEPTANTTIVTILKDSNQQVDTLDLPCPESG